MSMQTMMIEQQRIDRARRCALEGPVLEESHETGPHSNPEHRGVREDRCPLAGGGKEQGSPLNGSRAFGGLRSEVCAVQEEQRDEIDLLYGFAVMP